MKLLNRVASVRELGGINARKERPLSLISYLIVHRQAMGEHAKECCEAFSDVSLGTGGKQPYHFIIRRDGVIEQAVPLGIAAPAARKFNRCGVQIGVYGDFRRRPPTEEQLQALVELCVALQFVLKNTKIAGHSDCEGAAAPGKVCPGKHLPTELIRGMVEEYRKSEKKFACDFAVI